jgi:hypothetical protein
MPPRTQATRLREDAHMLNFPEHSARRAPAPARPITATRAPEVQPCAR